MKADELSAILQIILEEFKPIENIDEARPLISMALALGQVSQVLDEIEAKAIETRTNIINRIRGLT